MALGCTVAQANTNLDNTIPAGLHVKLHVGDPGAAGTSNPAAETTRKALSVNAASSASKDSSAQLQWTNITGSEDATHFSLWDDPTAGSFKFSGTITANPYTAGDTLTIAAGQLVFTHAGVAA